MILYREGARWPQIITTLRIKAPTGDPPKEEGLSLVPVTGPALSDCNSSKPRTRLFFSGGFNIHMNSRQGTFFSDGTHNIQPGETIGYNFGFGFAVNENVSLSSQVSGSYQWETHSDGTTVSGSSTEPVSLRAALTYRISKKSYIEPSVTFGFNNDTPNFIISLSGTRRF